MEKITINIIDHNKESHSVLINIDSEMNLMEVVRDAGFQMGNCGGMALCASSPSSAILLNILYLYIVSRR